MKKPLPNWIESRQLWQFDFQGKRYRRKHKADADALVEQLVAEAESPLSQTDPTVTSLFSAFLEDYAKRVERGECAAASLELLADPLASLGQHLPRRLRISQFKPAHVNEWLHKHYTYAKRTGKLLAENSRRQPKRAVMQALGWCVRMKYINSNPLAGAVVVGKYTGSEDYVTDSQWAKLMKHVHCPNFRDYLRFLRYSGCRPQEAHNLNASHVDKNDPDHKRCVVTFLRTESKGKKKKRRLLLTGETWEIVNRRVTRQGEGPVLTDNNGNRWNANAVRHRLARLEKHVGFKIKARNLRHSFATEFLKNGGSPAACAALMGHASTQMVMENYQHVMEDVEHLYGELDDHIDTSL